MSNPFSFGVRLPILLIFLSENCIAFIIPTYLPYMIGDLLKYSTSPEDLDAQVSYNVAYIEGLNRLMSFIASLIWGYVSDRIGRKYSLLMVLSGMSISSLGFGLSTSFEEAVIWRMISGLCQGAIPITKAMMQDLSDDSNIAFLYSFSTAGFGIASIIGPLVSGVFSNPYNTFSFLDTEFFHTFPYFMPHLLQ